MTRSTSPSKPIVMVSSTARDLPKHRKQVLDACLRAGFDPKMMEHLPASDDDAVEVSLRMVDEAEIYLGIFAHRYGYVPEGAEISITEMEYRRAVETGKPRLIFFIHKKHPLKIDDVETGPGAEKLKRLKDEIGTQRVADFFESPKDLRGLVIHALYEHRKRKQEAGEAPVRAPMDALHYIAPIPKPPEAYIAHPYTLLQTRNLVARRKEMDLLTDWLTGRGRSANASIFTLVAFGGMGKSALTWHWFQKVAPQEKKLAGSVWWSFYESDATFENFVLRTAAYLSGQSLEAVKDLPVQAREDLLFRHLDQEPHLVVLDGLERILVAYARMDAPYLRDDDLDDDTANDVAGALGLPRTAGQSFVGRHPLRQAVDPRAGRFLLRLTQIRNSKVLVSSRLYPAALQSLTGTPLPGSFARFLPGLSEDDALELWRAFGARRSQEQMLPFFNTFERHPLLLQILAGEVARYRRAPGDFDRRRADSEDSNPFGVEIQNLQSHILAHALRGLEDEERRVLHVIAGFRMPASFESIEALLVQKEEDDAEVRARKPFRDLQELDAALTTLEDRGLLGWEPRANRYDLHPIVRGVTWSGLEEGARRDVFTTLRGHFEAMPMVDDWQKVETLDDLAPALELYNTLVGLGRLEDAFAVFRDRLERATLYRLGTARLRVELLERLFPEGVEAEPGLEAPRQRSYVLNSLAIAYQFSGRPGAAAPLYQRAARIDQSQEDLTNFAVDLCNLSDALRLAGQPREAEGAAREALRNCREREDRFQEGVSLYLLGLNQALRGEAEAGEAALGASLEIRKELEHRQGQGLVRAFLAETALWRQAPEAAQEHARRAWELAAVHRHAADFVRAARLHGNAALRLNDLEGAERWLHEALTRVRAIDYVEEELPTLIALAELAHHRGEEAAARDWLAEVWELAETGPFPIYLADAHNLLARIEGDAGHAEAAVKSATTAYRHAWCDGPPFAYHRGLEAAREHLRALGAPAPEMPPFDASKYAPMVEVEVPKPEPRKPGLLSGSVGDEALEPLPPEELEAWEN